MPEQPTFRWLQEECRTGTFKNALMEFSASQDERLQPLLARVESVTDHGIICVIPGKHIDHESKHPYDVEVRCSIDPLTRSVLRL